LRKKIELIFERRFYLTPKYFDFITAVAKQDEYITVYKFNNIHLIAEKNGFKQKIHKKNGYIVKNMSHRAGLRKRKHLKNNKTIYFKRHYVDSFCDNLLEIDEFFCVPQVFIASIKFKTKRDKNKFSSPYFFGKEIVQRRYNANSR